MSKVNVAMIGYGHLGKWHAQKAFSLANLVAIVDPSEQARSVASKEYPSVKVVNSLSEVIDEVDAVLIVSPTKFHFEICKEVIKAGKHVFCEKPVTENLSQSLELLEMVEGKDIVFQVGHSERCHQAWEIISGDIIVKEAKSVHIKRVSPFKGRASDVSVVEDLMIHDVDLALMFYGRPESVKAIGTKSVTDKLDYVRATLDYGALEVVVEDSRCDVEVERSIHFRSNHGEIKVDLFSNSITKASGFLDNGEQKIVKSDYEKRDHLYIEQEKFYKSILNKTKPFVSLEEGVNALRVLDEIVKDVK